MAVVLLFSSVVLGQQPNTPTPSVPDAPTPQQPDSLGDLSSGVTPGRGSQPPAQDQGTNSTQAPPASTTPGQASTQDQQPQETAPEIKSLQTFVTRVNYVVVPATVLDKKHQQVAGLTWRDFQIYENNMRQRIAFFSADAVPLSVALVIDQSLDRDTMTKVNDSLSCHPERLHGF